MHVIEARQVKKVYGSGEARVEALRGVDLQIAAGTLLAIMGASGSGKSTLLTLLGGIDLPTGGQVLLEDVDLAKLDDDERTLIRRRRIGFVFQAFNLLPTLSAAENVSLPLELDGVGRAEACRRAEDALQMVEVHHRRAHLPGMLSGGEQQRVAIARALVIQPAVLLADEPTGNLDSATGEKVTELLWQLVNERHQTIVLVTHDAHVAAHADRLVLLSDGRIESETTDVKSALQAAVLIKEV